MCSHNNDNIEYNLFSKQDSNQLIKDNNKVFDYNCNNNNIISLDNRKVHSARNDNSENKFLNNKKCKPGKTSYKMITTDSELKAEFKKLKKKKYDPMNNIKNAIYNDFEKIKFAFYRGKHQDDCSHISNTALRNQIDYPEDIEEFNNKYYKNYLDILKAHNVPLLRQHKQQGLSNIACNKKMRDLLKSHDSININDTAELRNIRYLQIYAFRIYRYTGI